MKKYCDFFVNMVHTEYINWQINVIVLLRNNYKNLFSKRRYSGPRILIGIIVKWNGALNTMKVTRSKKIKKLKQIVAVFKNFEKSIHVIYFRNSPTQRLPL